MEKNVEISMLCQVYGKVLTEKQHEILNDYYNNDLSLSEIAENNNITRQAVRDIIKKSENKLYELEKNIGYMSKIIENEKKVKYVEEQLNILKELELSEMDKDKSNIKLTVSKKISLIDKALKKVQSI